MRRELTRPFACEVSVLGLSCEQFLTPFFICKFQFDNRPAHLQDMTYRFKNSTPLEGPWTPFTFLEMVRFSKSRAVLDN